MNASVTERESNLNSNLKDFSAKDFFDVYESYRAILSEKDSLTISSAPELRVEIENKWKAANHRMQEILLALHGKEAAIYKRYTMSDGGPKGESVRLLKDVHFIENAWDVIAEIILGVKGTSFERVTNHTGYLNTISRNVLNSNCKPKASDGIIGTCRSISLPNEDEENNTSDEMLSIQAAKNVSSDEEKYLHSESGYVETVPMDIDSRKLRIINNAYRADKINTKEYKLLYLLVHGFNMKEVSLKLNIPRNTLYSMKTRVKSKLLPFVKREITLYGPMIND